MMMGISIELHANVRNIVAFLSAPSIPRRANYICPVLDTICDCDEAVTVLSSVLHSGTSQRGSRHGEHHSPSVLSCARLGFIEAKKIVRSDGALSDGRNPLGDLARRPCIILAELGDSATRDTDLDRELTALDGMLFEICG
jgi:hypothetical protein